MSAWSSAVGPVLARLVIECTQLDAPLAPLTKYLGDVQDVDPVYAALISRARTEPARWWKEGGGVDRHACPLLG